MKKTKRKPECDIHTCGERQGHAAAAARASTTSSWTSNAATRPLSLFLSFLSGTTLQPCRPQTSLTLSIETCCALLPLLGGLFWKTPAVVPPFRTTQQQPERAQAA